MDMEQIQKDLGYILKLLFTEWSISQYQYDKNDILHIFHGRNEQDRTIINRDMLREWRRNYNGIPMILIEEDLIFYMLFLDKEENLYLMGPAVQEYINFTQLHAYCKRHGVSGKGYQIPRMPVYKAVNCLTTGCYMITGEKWEPGLIMEQNKVKNQLNEREVFEYDFDRKIQEAKHMSYKEELAWLKKIEDGTLDMSAVEGDSNYTEQERVGVLAKKDNLKQTEYMVISAVCLATRAAIRGGVSAAEAYALSELYYQKIAKAADHIEILSLYQQAVTTLSDRVRNKKESKHPYDYVELAKDYIARNYHHKFTLQKLAEDIHVSRNYLARIFPEETGMTLSQYLTKKRLAIAVNMLKYSDENIGSISDYLCFNTQSHFGELFKKEYGMTPLEFRRKYKAVDFDQCHE